VNAPITRQRGLIMNLLSKIFSIFKKNHTENNRTWKTGEFEHEGFPLFLRFPVGLEYDELKHTYPQFITVTHFLDEVKSNGLPESEYNKSLFDFDDQLVNILEKANAGMTVLVETFAGKRIYYMYSKSDFPPSLLENKIKESFPDHKIEVESNSDKEWSFIKGYSKDWNF
jgi:hypothetical protein